MDKVYNIPTKDLYTIREFYVDQTQWCMDNYKTEIIDYISHLEEQIIEINMELIKRGEIR